MKKSLNTAFLGLLALGALLAAPAAVRAQTFYVSSGSQTIDKVDSTGAVSLFATLPADSVPYGLAFDGSGNLYAADSNTDQISKITSGGVVSLFATLPGGSEPGGLAFDGSGNLYVADVGTSQISKITSGGDVSTFVPSFKSLGSSRSSLTAPRFSNPSTSMGRVCLALGAASYRLSSHSP